MAKAKIVLKNKMKNGEYRVNLRVSHLNQPAKYIKLPLKSKPNEWNSRNQRFKKNKYHFKELNQSIKDVETLAENILSKFEINDDFSFEAFEKAFHNNGKVKEVQTVNDAFVDKLNQLEATKRYGSYRTYYCFGSNKFGHFLVKC